MGQIWGTVEINQRVYEEIVRRQNLMGTKYKTAEQLSYLNANDPWVVLRSGVDVEEDSDCARQYTLTGGRAEGFDSVKAVVGDTGPDLTRNGGLIPRRGLSLSSKGTSSYYDGSFGIRPMPGITSFTIKNKDTWGAVQEATVNLKVFSLEDLDMIDNLYFRPGFTALLEWGWSLVWDGKKMVTDSPKLMPFFGTETLPQLQERIPNIETPNHGVLLGYITNFHYSLQKDGSYDCWVKILGTGSILEGMKILPAPEGKLEPKKKSENGEEDTIQSWIAPIYTAILEGKNKAGSSTLKTILEKAGYTGLEPVQGPDGDILVDLGSVTTMTYSVFLKRKWFVGKRTEPITYVKLNDVLKLINAYGIDLVHSGYRFGVKEDVGISLLPDGGTAPVNEIYDNNYVCPKTLFSLDPFKVIVPERQKAVIRYSVPDEQGAYATGDVQLVKDDEVNSVPGGEAGKILDLWVSLNWLYSLIQYEIDSNDKDFLTINYVRSMVSGISKALGNVVDLDIGIDEKTLRYYIVDRNFLEKQDLKEIIPCGLKTTFLGIEAESNITSEMANMMSVAAQGGKDISPALTSWNHSLTERHPMDGTSKKVEDSDDKDWQSLTSNTGEFWKDAQIIYKQMFAGQNSHTSSDTSELSETAYQKLQLVGEILFSEAVQIESDCGSGMPVGVFPLKFGFTMRGIQGFVIGECFRVTEGILPVKYKDWSYIVTGVEHQVDTNGWITKVRTQYYPNDLKAAQNYYNSGEKLERIAPGFSGNFKNKKSNDQRYESAPNTVTTESKDWNYIVFSNPNVNSRVYGQDPVEFMQKQGYSVASSQHNCSGGSFLYVRLLCSSEGEWGKILPYNSMHSSTVPAQGTVSATSPTYFGMLEAKGYSKVDSGTGVDISAVKAAASNMKPGDVISYWGGPNNKYHTCVRRVKPKTVSPGQGWISDFLQSNMFVYKSPNV